MRDAVNVDDAVNVGDAVNVCDAVNVGDDVIVDNCDVATVGDGNITLVNTSVCSESAADCVLRFRVVFVLYHSSPSKLHTSSRITIQYAGTLNTHAQHLPCLGYYNPSISCRLML